MLRAPTRAVLASLLALLLGTTACMGLADQRAWPSTEGEGPAGAPAGGGDVTPGEPGEPAGPLVPLELVERRAWRLTPLQYERSFVATFGTTHVLAKDFPLDPNRKGFDDVAAQNHVDIVWAELVQRNAAEVAAELAPGVGEGMTCLRAAAPTRACVGALVDLFGARAFRRPVDTDVRDALVNLFLALRAAGNSPEAAIAGVLEAIAQSPLFLYRVETGEPAADGREQLDAYAVASQLSYMLTDAPPDAALLAAAADGQLLDRTVVLDHARRLLDTPHALQKVSRFFDQYLGIFPMRGETVPKDASAFPRFSPEVQAAMMAETDRFVARVVFAEGGTLPELFTSRRTYVDERLRAFYGWPGTASPDVPFEIPAGERAGIFMQGAFLAARSQSLKTDPLHRGLFIYERILCQHIQPPPGLDIFEAADLLNPPDPQSTERERLDYLVQQHPQCGGCHASFVSLGLSLETFDPVGVHRKEQNGRPLDPSGELVLLGEPGGPYADAIGLFERVAQSRQAQACFAENWLTYAFGADFPVPMSARLVEAFRSEGLRIRDLLVLPTQEDAFYFRRTGDSK